MKYVILKHYWWICIIFLFYTGSLSAQTIKQTTPQTISEIALGVHDMIKKAGLETPRPKGDFNL
ncbi:MAG: hypothetical protein MRK02_16560 [Candidatus Scalindua sp.]|nr:hypothetical protein [Candidatus Scalindua sp.]